MLGILLYLHLSTSYSVTDYSHKYVTLKCNSLIVVQLKNYKVFWNGKISEILNNSSVSSSKQT